MAADERGVVVHRSEYDDVRIPLVQLVSAGLDEKELTLKTSDRTTYRLTSWCVMAGEGVPLGGMIATSGSCHPPAKTLRPPSRTNSLVLQPDFCVIAGQGRS